MCIYYGDAPGLTYEKREHIFPAGLGGKMMLPTGYVSDQANELFSPLELKLMRNSTISLIRFMEGPGKRGSLSPQKASSSTICKYEADDGGVELGFIKAGKPYPIPQISIDLSQNTCHFVGPKNESTSKEIWATFKKDLLKFSGKFTAIHVAGLGSKLIIGIWEKKFYVAYGEEVPNPKFLSDKIESFCEKAEATDKSLRDTHGKFELHLTEDSDSCRVYAKIAYNVLAHIKGEKFVQQSRFDKIRKWILGEIETEEFITLPRIYEKQKYLTFPESSHFCVFSRNENNKLVAIVCLYNTFLRAFEFAEWDPSSDSSRLGIEGFVCDWKKEAEYTMDEWIFNLTRILLSQNKGEKPYVGEH